ncbi:MAG: hypothetical protein AABY26_00615 [Nanoarchaeota archaeon]
MNDERDRLITKIRSKDDDPNEQLALAQEYSSAHPEDAEFQFFVGETLCVTAYEPEKKTFFPVVLEEATDCFESLKDDVKYGERALGYLETIHLYLADNLGAREERAKHYRKFGELGHEQESLLSLCGMYIDKKKWTEAEKYAEDAFKAGVPEETFRKIYLRLADNNLDLEARAKYYSKLGDPNSLLTISLLCAEQGSWKNAEDFAKKSIDAGLPQETTKRIHTYLAENMPTPEDKIRNYTALTGNPFALLAISLLNLEQKEKDWEGIYLRL